MNSVNSYELINIEAEQGILGIILFNPKTIKKCYIRPCEMYDEKHQIILKGLLNLYEKKYDVDDVELTMLVSKFTDIERESIGGISYLTQLLNSQFSDIYFDKYQKLVKDTYLVRKTYELVQEYTNNPSLNGMFNLNSGLQDLTFKRHAADNGNYETIVDIHETVYRQRKGLTGMDTGFKELNIMTDGLQGGDLIIVAARPSMGKTALAVNLAANACKSKATVLFFSLEMSKKQVLTRAICAEANVNMSFFAKGEKFLTASELQAITKAEGEVAKWKLVICEDTNVQTVKDISTSIHTQLDALKTKKALIVIDYLQLIQTDKSISRHDLQIGQITRGLKLLAKELNVPIVLLSQLNRGVENRNDKRPMMSDLRDSGSIEQDADIIMLLHREDYYDRKSENKNLVEVDIAKHRNGPVGTVKLYFEKETGKFRDLQ